MKLYSWEIYDTTGSMCIKGSTPDTNKISVAVNKVLRVIDSCVSKDQLDVAGRLVDNFINMFGQSAISRMLHSFLSRKYIIFVDNYYQNCEDGYDA